MGPLKKKTNPPVHLFINHLISKKKFFISSRVTLSGGDEGEGGWAFNSPACFNKVCTINEQFLIDFDAI